MSRGLLRAVLLGAVVLGTAREAWAQCASGATHVTWPAANPVWDFCFLSPGKSAGANGSGLELSNVRYNGVLVLFQAHIPILNVKYVPNAANCGGQNACYRDWLYGENAFSCAPEVSTGYCTGTTTPATTVCEHPGTDAGSFVGVAVEDLGTSLKLTAQCAAGWYRYIPVWEFFADGTLQTRFVATSVNNGCVAYTHQHHAYFRLDFDLNGGSANSVDQVLSGGVTQRATTERNYIDTSPARSTWRVTAPGSAYFVEVTRNPEDGAAGDPLPITNDFPVADGWVLAYDPNQIADYSNLQTCPANLNSFMNGQSVDGTDIVMWVRAAALHEGEPGGLAQDCSMVGPTIRVIPVSPLPTAFHTLTPCRAIDTRGAAGPYGAPALQPGGIRTFVLANRCGIPVTAKSVAANVAVSQPTAGGYLTIFPAGGAVPLASAINFSAGQTRANNAVMKLGAGGAISVQSGLSGSAQLILDVTGYFE
jgi:hypothetical protein